MRSLPLILAAVLVLFGAGVARAAPSQAPNQNGGNAPEPNGPPNQDGGSGQLPVAPTATPRATPTPTPSTPTPSAAPTPDGPLAPAAPARTSPKKLRPPEALPVIVKRLRGCLPDVARREARVLVLRTGLGRAKPTPRDRIADALDVSATAVGRAERSGARRLRARARASTCETDEDAAGPLVQDAVAALAAGKGGGGSASTGDQAANSAMTSDPAGSRSAAVAGGGDKTTALLFAALAGLLGFALLARGLLKGEPD